MKNIQMSSDWLRVALLPSEISRIMYVCTCTFLFSKVMEKYLVPDYANVQEFLAHLGKRLGKLKKGKIFIKRSNESCNSGLCCLKLVTQNQD